MSYKLSFSLKLEWFLTAMKCEETKQKARSNKSLQLTPKVSARTVDSGRNSANP